jgi:hypothetical protein
LEREQNGRSIETAGVGKTAATRLAKADGVSLNQFIAAAVAEKVSVLETAEDSCADAGNR